MHIDHWFLKICQDFCSQSKWVSEEENVDVLNATASVLMYDTGHRGYLRVDLRTVSRDICTWFNIIFKLNPNTATHICYKGN